MSDWLDRVNEELDTLRAARDEMRVRLHLGKAEAQERWDQLEKQWHHAEGRLKVLREQASESAADVGDAARKLVDELKDGVEQLRKLI
ncbi:MAG: hypothetical protein ACQGVK_08060 [Myxococcota bacterium]